MITYNVQSNEKPEKISYFPHDGKAEVYIRTEAVQKELEDGTVYEYDEVYFVTEETMDKIEANPDVFYEYGKSWSDDAPLNQEQLIANLQKDTKQNTADIAFLAMIAGVDLEE
jgi:hypothetical protein